MRKEMSKMVDVFGLKRWYQRLLAENFYKFLVSLGLLACVPLIASVVFDYIVIDGDGRFKASILLGFVLLLLFLLLSFISIAIWAAINSKATGQRRMVLIISAYLMIWLAFGNLYYFFSDTENFVATNTTSIEGLVKEWDGDMHVTDLQESTVLRNVPHFWELVPVTRDDGKEHFLPRTVNRVDRLSGLFVFQWGQHFDHRLRRHSARVTVFKDAGAAAGIFRAVHQRSGYRAVAVGGQGQRRLEKGIEFERKEGKARWAEAAIE